MFGVTGRSEMAAAWVKFEGIAVLLPPTARRLYVAIGAPGVIDVIGVDSMSRIEVVPTEVGAHTMALHKNRNKVYVLLPKSNRAAVFLETD